MLYIVNRITHQLVGTAATVREAVCVMMKHVPSMEDAHKQFVLRSSKPTLPRQPRYELPGLDFGPYAGKRLDQIPTRYLDRVIDWCKPWLQDAIRTYLASLPSYHRADEQLYRDDENHRRDFDPSRSRGR